MKRGAKMLILLAVLLVLTGGTFLTRNLVAKVNVVEEEDILLFESGSESLTGLRWSYEGETMELRKQNGEWICNDMPDFPLSAAAAERLANAVSEIRAEKVIDVPEDLNVYGLDEPLCTVTVLRKEETETVLTIGTAESLDGYRYLTVGDGKVYLTDSSLGESFSCNLYDLVLRETLPSMSYVTAMRVFSDVQSYELCRFENSGLAYTDEYEWFLQEGDDWVALDSTAVENHVDTVRILGWKSCVSWDADEEDLTSFGLDEPSLTAELDYTVENRVATDITTSDGDTVYETVTEENTFRVEFGDYAPSGSCYARLSGSNMIYTVDSSVLDTLLYMNSESLLPSDVISLQPDDILTVEVTEDGDTFEFIKSSRTVTDEDGNSSTETVWQLNGEDTTFDEVLSKLLNLTAAGLANGEEPLREAELSFLFHRKSETHPETELCFCPYDSTYSLVTVDGNRTVLVSRYDVASLAEQLNELTEQGS